MNPILFYDGPEISIIDRHRSVPQAEEIIITSINETIRQLLPVRRILKTYLQDVYEEKQPVINEEELVTKSDTEEKKNQDIEIESNNISETMSEPIISDTINDFIEEIPDLSEAEIEDIISKQEFIIPEYNRENETMKQNLISELDQEFNNISNTTTEVTTVPVEVEVKPVEVVEVKPVEVVEVKPVEVVEVKPVEVVEVKPVEVVEVKPVEVVEVKPVEVVEVKPVEVVEVKPVEVVEVKPVEVVEVKPVEVIEVKPVEVVEVKPVEDKETIKNVEVLDEKNNKLKKKDSNDNNLTIQKEVEPSNELKIDLDLDFDEEINLDDNTDISIKDIVKDDFKPTTTQKFKFF